MLRLSERASLAVHAGRLHRRLFSSNLSLIKTLRERTGAPMHEVKAALQASNWDIDAALEALQRQGLTAASKKASRTAAEGLVAVASSGDAAAIVEVNCETDFVARNPKFQDLARSVAHSALDMAQKQGARADTHIPVEALKDARIENQALVTDALVAVAAEVRENVQLRRAAGLHAPGSVIGTYVHGAIPGPSSTKVGRMGAIVSLVAHPEVQGKHGAELGQLAVGLAMHVVANRPVYVSKERVPQQERDRRLEALRNETGQPAEMLATWHKETCLLQQPYLLDDTHSVHELLRAAEGRLGCSLSVADFVRMAAGEGIEREAKDFAQEVAAVAGVKA